VNSSVKSSGASSKAKSTLLEVSDVILVWPIRCWMSLPDRVIAAKPPQRAKNAKAALLFSKNARTAGSKTKITKRASVIIG
jgi:hypothetical protein